MKKNHLSALALFVSFVALAFALMQPFAGERPSALDASVPDPHVTGLDDRLATLEQRVTALDHERGQESLDTPLRVPVGAEGRLPTDVLGRLTALEQEVLRLEARAWSLDDLVERGYRVVRPGYDEETLREWTAKALDEEAGEAERLEALRHLRGQFLDERVDARLAVLLAMLELAQASDSPDTRATIWRQLGGIDDPVLIEPLVASMRGDASPKVRAAAARSLAAFRSDPTVTRALEDTLSNDLDELVKDAAFEARHDQLRRPVQYAAGH